VKVTCIFRAACSLSNRRKSSADTDEGSGRGCGWLSLREENRER
jgi:hypothetical protein